MYTSNDVSGVHACCWGKQTLRPADNQTRTRELALTGFLSESYAYKQLLIKQTSKSPRVLSLKASSQKKNCHKKSCRMRLQPGWQCCRQEEVFSSFSFSAPRWTIWQRLILLPCCLLPSCSLLPFCLRTNVAQRKEGWHGVCAIMPLVVILLLVVVNCGFCSNRILLYLPMSVS